MIFNRRPNAPTTPASELAIEIIAADLALIDQLSRYLKDLRPRARRDMTFDHYGDTDRERLIKNLYLRAGAATVDDPQAYIVPMLVHEIATVERLAQDIAYFHTYMHFSGIHPKQTAADNLVAKLYILQGRAAAIRELGDIIVFVDPPKALGGPAADQA